MTGLDLDSLRWKKSSRSGQNGNCVEVARLADSIAVRDSKQPDGSVLVFSEVGWAMFVNSVRSSELDRY